VNQLEYQASYWLQPREPTHGGYKHIDTSPRFIAVDLERQLLPGTCAIGRASSAARC
jgi:hypothetical protein